MSWYKHLMINNDVSEIINSAIHSAPPYAIIDGEGGFYNVHSIWLKSNITFKNFNLKSIGTNETDVSVLCIGNDFDYDNNPNPFLADKYAERVYKQSTTLGETNIKIENVNIDGNRTAHTNLGPYDRNGGKQGICIKGIVSRIKIKDCALQFCATDGLQIYSGLLHDGSNDSIFAATDIEIDNVICEWNRRHGASGDSINKLCVRNSKFHRNGRNIDGALVEGNEGSSNADNELYGNGWDMEGYGVGSNLSDINFINCEFFGNFKAGLLIYEIATGQENGFVERSNMFFSTCRFDSGLENPNFTAVDIIGSQANLQNGIYLFDNIIFDNCNFNGRILGKSIRSLIIRNCQQIYHPSDNMTTRGLFENVKSATVRNTQTKRYLWEGQNFEIVSDDILTKSLDFNFGTMNAGGIYSVDTVFPEAEFGDIVTVTFDKLNEARFKEFLLTGLVPYPGSKVLITLKNNSNQNEAIDPGKLKIFVEKKLIIK